MTNIITSYKQNVTRNNNLKSKLQQTHTTTQYFLLPTLHRIVVVESDWTTVM